MIKKLLLLLLILRVLAPISYITWVALRDSKFWHNFLKGITTERLSAPPQGGHNIVHAY